VFSTALLTGDQRNAALNGKTLTFVHISDTHLHPDPNYISEFIDFNPRDHVEKLVDVINNLEVTVDFVMHTGDILHSPESPDDYEVAREILGKIDYPAYYIPGNHDKPAWLQAGFWQRDADDIVPNCDYQFTMNDVQVVMLDSHNNTDDKTSEGAYGILDPDQLEWLYEICSSDETRPLIVGIHHHVMPLGAPWVDKMGMRNGIDVHNTLLKAKHRLRGVFYGHIHESVVTVRDGISYYSVQSGWFQTRTWYNAQQPAQDWLHNPGFNLVTITPTDMFVRFRRI